MLGPFRGGRVDAVCGVPGRPNEFYFGAVNGGVWKSIDAGRVWKPVFDSQPVASIGAIAVAPSAPDIVYVGTGESTLRDSMGFGNGMYKSTDAGKTWTHIGLDDTQHIGRVAVDPKNPNIVFVAAIGHLVRGEPGARRLPHDGRRQDLEEGALQERERRRRRSRDRSGESAGRVRGTLEYAAPAVVHVRADERTGRRHLQVDRRRHDVEAAHDRAAEGGHRQDRHRDRAEQSAARVRGGRLPRARSERAAAGRGGGGGGRGRRRQSGVCAAQAPPGQGGFFRSDDAGATWTKLSSDQALWGRGWYFEHVVVDPKNADIVYVPNVAVSRSKDGGKTWVPLRGSPGGDDYHQPWVSPDDSNTMIVASDQGAIITRNALTDDPRDVTWSSWLNQPTAQIYHVSVDYRFPYWVTGAQQDSGAVAVRSRGKFAEISMRDWEPIGAGGESGYTAGDPLHPGIIFGGTGQRFDLETQRAGRPARRRRARPTARAPTGRSRSSSRRPIRTRSTTPISSSSRRPTARRRGRRSARISRAPTPAFRRTSTRRPRRRWIATASAASSTRSRRRRSPRRCSGSAPTTA